GELVAPTAPGIYRLVVSGDGSRTEIPIVVAKDVARATPEATELLTGWVGARGGRTLPAARLDELSSLISAAIQPTSSRVTWHPLRSAWWIIPFALALSGEWWLRR